MMQTALIYSRLAHDLLVPFALALILVWLLPVLA